MREESKSGNHVYKSARYNEYINSANGQNLQDTDSEMIAFQDADMVIAASQSKDYRQIDNQASDGDQKWDASWLQNVLH